MKTDLRRRAEPIDSEPIDSEPIGNEPIRNDRPESGASLVEFAILAPLLFAVLIGTITAGVALGAKNSMTNAVREGGRLGATLHSDDPSWTWNDWAQDVTDRVDDLAGGDLDADEVCAQIVDVTPSPDVVLGSDIGADCPLAQAPATPASATSGCLVKVWARRDAELNVVFFSRTLTLDARAIGVYERSDCP
jgi:Flp pilus assembly pilin Flp